MPKELTQENFDAEVLEASKIKPVLVDFWADWCGPCHAQAPVIEELASEYAGKAEVAKLDIEAHMDIATKYNVMSIPTLIVFRNGDVAERFLGVQEKETLTASLDKHA